ncbi:MAG: insulinase family protein [Eubacterium sp.]|nr:insulinase family protein [Eubacterium sp.]
MNNNENIKELKEYEVILHKYIEDVSSDAWLLKHKKSGARVALLSNDDENKVFNIGFRTPVEDNTGVPHIVEHTVLCGSEKYPVKDPFVELIKGSLNTFLNAMTYPDKTVYPVASCNDKDFKNLMEIYMDAVLNPNIYKEEKIFKQEGWHYELDSPDGELIYNGVVYNEMKGVFSSPDGVMDRMVFHSVFPDITYGFESGGDPKEIPELSYEQYLDFHSRYYHPTNSYIYLYGNMDMVERLQWMDQEYLSKYEKIELDSEVKDQKAFSEMKVVRGEYAVSENEDLKGKAFLSMNYVVGKTTDIKLMKAMELLTEVLMDMQGAPLKQALIDAGIGKDVYGRFETDLKQPTFSVVAKFAEESDKEKLKEVVETTLKKLVQEGLNKHALEARLNRTEFIEREADQGRFPKGLIWGLDMFSTWLYDENKAFDCLEIFDVLAELREEIKTDYFEKLIEQYLLQNTHKSLVVLAPKQGLTKAEEEKTKKKLAELKASMSKEEIERIIQETKELKEYQSETDTPEDLECIPLLEISDIRQEPRETKNEVVKRDGTTMLYHDIDTNGISYIDLYFDCTNLPERYYPYLGMLSGMFEALSTEHYHYSELNSVIDFDLGGLAFGSGNFDHNETGEPIIVGEIHTKMINGKMPKAFELIEEIVKTTNFRDEKRLKERLDAIYAGMQGEILGAGHAKAIVRAASNYSKNYYIREKMNGISAYYFIKNLVENYEAKKEEIMDMFEKVVQLVFSKERMILNFAGSRDAFEQAATYTLELKEKMYQVPMEAAPEIVLAGKNEAFATAGSVQFVAKMGNFKEDYPNYKGELDGKFLVLEHVMNYEYLWEQIRVLGGAYGCGSTTNSRGDVGFYSYRDPKLKETAEVYDQVVDFVEHFTVDDRKMRKFIIGAINNQDTPMNPYTESLWNFRNYYTGISDEKRAKNRKDLLSTTQEDIRNLAPYLKSALQHSKVAVVGSAGAIENHKEMFDEIKEVN